MSKLLALVVRNMLAASAMSWLASPADFNIEAFSDSLYFGLQSLQHRRSFRGASKTNVCIEESLKSQQLQEQLYSPNVRVLTGRNRKEHLLLSWSQRRRHIQDELGCIALFGMGGARIAKAECRRYNPYGSLQDAGRVHINSNWLASMGKSRRSRERTGS